VDVEEVVEAVVMVAGADAGAIVDAVEVISEVGRSLLILPTLFGKPGKALQQQDELCKQNATTLTPLTRKDEHYYELKTTAGEHLAIVPCSQLTSDGWRVLHVD